MSREPWWTPARLDLRDWLRRQSPGLAEGYAGAVSLIYGTALPGRLRFVAHAVRDIGAQLPYLLSGIKDPRLDYPARVEVLANMWRGQRGTVAVPASGAGGVTDSGAIPSPEVSISGELYRLMEDLIRDHLDTNLKPDRAALRLFGADVPAALQWASIVRWFAKKPHFSSKPDTEYDWNEVIRKFEMFERTLHAVSTGFFVGTRGIDEIVDEANS